MKDTIGVIGCGFVGKAVVKGFEQFADVKIYDTDEKKSIHDFKEVVNCDFVFICLPTPMISSEGGRANLSILEKCMEDISNVENRNKDSIYVIKSTVPIGTTKRFVSQYKNLRIVHNPEFLTARSAIIDFICPARNIVGADWGRDGKPVQDLLIDRFPGTRCIAMTSEESETVKYMANSFLATKVIFFNEMRLLVDKKNLDWDRVISGVMSDGRIGTSHYQVPGHDGDRGFGGLCVLPDAKVSVSSNFCYFPEFLNDEDSSYMRSHAYSNREIRIEDLYDEFKDRKKFHFLLIQSCNDKIEEIEDKYIRDVTVRDIDEEIYCFETSNSLFRCTSNHLMPVERQGK